MFISQAYKAIHYKMKMLNLCITWNLCSILWRINMHLPTETSTLVILMLPKIRIEMANWDIGVFQLTSKKSQQREEWSEVEAPLGCLTKLL